MFCQSVALSQTPRAEGLGGGGCVQKELAARPGTQQVFPSLPPEQSWLLLVPVQAEQSEVHTAPEQQGRSLGTTCPKDGPRPRTLG